jgi:hypothetical protein
MTNHAARGPVAHAGHDALLIAAHAAGDAAGKDLIEAERLVASCDECEELYTDLRLIASATAKLPAPRRPRDFTITAQQAARLRGRRWPDVLGGLAWVRGDGMRNLAAGLTTLGIAGLLLANVTLNVGFGGSAAMAPAPAATSGAGVQRELSGAAASGAPSTVAAPAASAPVASAGPAYAPSPAGTRGTSVNGRLGSSSPEVGITGEGGGSSSTDTGSSESPQPQAYTSAPSPSPASQTNPAVALSAAFLVAGVGLFALRRIAGRGPGS